MYWEKDIETLSFEKLKEYQLIKLKETIFQSKKSEYYGKKLKDIDSSSINSISDISNLPFTTKQDMRDNFPYGFLTVPLDDVVRLHSSSGTTGNPTVVYHSKQDLDEWTNLVARCMYMVGVRKSDVFQNIMGYGLFTGGIGFHYGAEKLGVLTIPIGPGNSKRQIWFLKEFQVTTIHILPSYALRLYTFFEELGVDPKKDLKLKTAFIGSEPHSEEIRKKIELLYGLKAYNSYGLSEMNGPGVAFECQYQDGLHVWEDNFYIEIIDPDTGKVLPDGEEGELVITTLKRDAMPLIRYRTKDLTKIIPEKCKCGRTHRRIDRIKGRSDDMLIINGVNIFPVQIEKTIMKVPEVGDNYIIELKKENFMDKVFVKIEINENTFHGTLNEIEKLQKKITEELKSELGINPVVKFVESGSLPQSEGKAVRVYDLRNK
ncbi:MAG TPA: phenylacetate--CoA ligase [Spirochaetota bacterium]|nr:MAG: Phenylacetate-coenzyme A ligase [Spirochaetes bacterium ADurb.Bin133]HNZ26414.1 phenylacetate--CoA ligase [Spirochaetota bacterium]HOF00915.1 phenylacetate--CoA ligase [Spirochaetota bacterium]HOS33656.1 phenylacetate--CoA ligase [Spirochaetota bacterium]HOS56112.1 phenylacetate--CoA ligase [Spirochaetota bacterium]